MSMNDAKGKKKNLKELFLCACVFLLAAIEQRRFFYTDICRRTSGSSAYTQGSTGATVREIQSRLKRWGYYTEAWTAYLVQRQSKRSDIFKE